MIDDRRRSTLKPTSSAGNSVRIGRLSSKVTASKFEPVPIILEISSTVVRVGFAGEKSRPQHIILLEKALFDDDSKNNSSQTSRPKIKTKTESQWYLIVSPLIEQVYDRLMCKPSTRRIVCLFSNQRYTPLPFRRALRQHLWNRGVPALVELDPLEVLPIVQGWARGLAVNITREEAYCICHADGYMLPYTYQMVPSGGYKNWLQVKSTDDEVEDVFPTLLDPGTDDDKCGPLSSLVLAVLTSLQQCPRDVRIDVVSNVVFCGDGVALLPDLSRRVMRRVRELLSGDVLRKDSHFDAMIERFNETNYANVPLNLRSLESLASNVSLSSCSPFRPDWICWLGASLWAAVWNKYNDEETPIPWLFNTK